MAAALALLTLLLGCGPVATSPVGDGTDDPGADPGDDTGTPGGDEIPGASEVFESVTVRLSVAIPTVAVVEWRLAAEASAVWVEVGDTTAYGRRIEPDADAPDEASIVGMTPGATVHLRVVAVVGGVEYATDDVTVTAGELTDESPDNVIDDVVPGDAFGDIVMYTWFDAASAKSGVTMVDRLGVPVWSLPAVDGMIPVARPSRDGRSIVYLRQDVRPDETDAELCRVSLSGERHTCQSVPGAHHDFAELPGNKIAYLRSTSEPYGAYTLIGDELVERESDGSERVLWRMSDDVTPEWTQDWDQRGADHVDWTHANGIWWDQASDTWFVSSFTLKSMFAVAGDGSGLEWTLGGNHSDFDVDSAFGPQHAPQLVGDDLLMFDNSTDGVSRIVAYRLDENRGTARQLYAMQDPEATHAVVLGDAHRMPSGYFATGWGDVGRVIVFSPDGRMVWRLSLPAGTLVGEVHAFDDIDALQPS